MALEAAFNQLVRELLSLKDALSELRLSVVEDKPELDDVVLVDVFGDAAEDLLGWIEEAITASNEAREAARYPVNVERARQSLITCQQRFNLIANRVFSDLLSYERIEELLTFGRERGREWLRWAGNVKSALDSSKQPLYDVNETLFHCWQEITERISMTSVSVQATSVGQQITVPENRFVEQEGIT